MYYVARPLKFVLPRPQLRVSRLERAALLTLALEAAALLLPIPVMVKVALGLLPLALLGLALLESALYQRRVQDHVYRAAEELSRLLPYGWSTRAARLEASSDEQLPALSLFVTSPDDNAYLLLLPDTPFTPFTVDAPHGQLVDHAGSLVLPADAMMHAHFSETHRSRMLLVLGFGPEVPSFRLGKWTVSVAPAQEQVARLRAWEEMAVNEFGPSPQRVPPVTRPAGKHLGAARFLVEAAVQELLLTLGRGWIISEDVALRCGERCDALLTRSDGERFAVQIVTRRDTPERPDLLEPRFWSEEFLTAEQVGAPLAATPVLWQPHAPCERVGTQGRPVTLVQGSARVLSLHVERPANWSLSGWDVIDTSVGQ